MEGGHEGSLDGHMPAVISLAVGQLSSGAEDVVRRPVRCRGRPRYDGGPYRVQMISRGDRHRSSACGNDRRSRYISTVLKCALSCRGITSIVFPTNFRITIVLA